MDHYLSHFEPLKENKTFHHTETDNNNIHGNLLSPGFPCHSCSADENKDIIQNSLSLSVVNYTEWGMNFSVRKVAQQLSF